jgi:hypothetical protein
VRRSRKSCVDSAPDLCTGKALLYQALNFGA